MHKFDSCNSLYLSTFFLSKQGFPDSVSIILGIRQIISRSKRDLAARHQANRSSLAKSMRRIVDEIESIGSIELAVKATNILEKILWITFFVIGVSWLGYFMKEIIDNNNPKTSIRLPLEVKDLEYPAITICSESTTKYALPEVIANQLDPNSSIPQIEKWWKTLISRIVENSWLYDFEARCILKDSSERPNACKVNNQVL